MREFRCQYFKDSDDRKDCDLARSGSCISKTSISKRIINKQNSVNSSDQSSCSNITSFKEEDSIFSLQKDYLAKINQNLIPEFDGKGVSFQDITSKLLGTRCRSAKINSSETRLMDKSGSASIQSVPPVQKPLGSLDTIVAHAPGLGSLELQQRKNRFEAGRNEIVSGSGSGERMGSENNKMTIKITNSTGVKRRISFMHHQVKSRFKKRTSMFLGVNKLINIKKFKRVLTKQIRIRKKIDQRFKLSKFNSSNFESTLDQMLRFPFIYGLSNLLFWDDLLEILYMNSG